MFPVLYPTPSAGLLQGRMIYVLPGSHAALEVIPSVPLQMQLLQQPVTNVKLNSNQICLFLVI